MTMSGCAHSPVKNFTLLMKASRNLLRSATEESSRRLTDVNEREFEPPMFRAEQLFGSKTNSPSALIFLAEKRPYLLSGLLAVGYPKRDWRENGFKEKIWEIYDTEIRDPLK
jgi:hypothetical protein